MRAGIIMWVDIILCPEKGRHPIFTPKDNGHILFPRRAFLLRGGAFMAAAASPGTILGEIAQDPAHGADFPPLFNSREHRVTPSPAVAVNMFTSAVVVVV